MPDLAGRRNVRDEGFGRQAVRAQEHRRRLLLHVPGVAQPVDRRSRRAPASTSASSAATRPRKRGIGGGAAAAAGQGDGAAGRRGDAGPPLLLAETWDDAIDLAGWWMSEKLDGVRAYWDGTQFLSRLGNLFHAPGLVHRGACRRMPLDGELWIDRKKFQQTVSIVRRQDKTDHWKEVRFVVFDVPARGGPFEERLEVRSATSLAKQAEYAAAHEHAVVQRTSTHLRASWRGSRRWAARG